MLPILCIEAIGFNILEALLLEIKDYLIDDRKELVFSKVEGFFSCFYKPLSILLVIKVWNPVAGWSFLP